MAGNPFMDLISGAMNNVMGYLSGGQAQQQQQPPAAMSPAHMVLMNNPQPGPVSKDMNNLIEWAQQSGMAGPVNWDYKGHDVMSGQVAGMGPDSGVKLGTAAGAFQLPSRNLLFAKEPTLPNIKGDKYPPTPLYPGRLERTVAHELEHAAQDAPQKGRLQNQYEQLAQMQADKNPYVSDVVYPSAYEEGKMPARINPTSGENLMSLMSDLSAKNRAEDVVNAAPQAGTGTWSGGITRNTDTSALTPIQKDEVDAYYGTQPGVTDPKEAARFWAMSMLDKGAPMNIVSGLYSSLLKNLTSKR